MLVLTGIPMLIFAGPILRVWIGARYFSIGVPLLSHCRSQYHSSSRRTVSFVLVAAGQQSYIKISRLPRASATHSERGAWFASRGIGVAIGTLIGAIIGISAIWDIQCADQDGNRPLQAGFSGIRSAHSDALDFPTYCNCHCIALRNRNPATSLCHSHIAFAPGRRLLLRRTEGYFKGRLELRVPIKSRLGLLYLSELRTPPQPLADQGGHPIKSLLAEQICYRKVHMEERIPLKTHASISAIEIVIVAQWQS